MLINYMAGQLNLKLEEGERLEGEIKSNMAGLGFDV